MRMPSRVNSCVGLAASQGLVSRDGLFGPGSLNDRIGPACRTVEDAARVMDVIAGYDPADDLTAYAVNRLPPSGYVQFARELRLDGIRIGIVREYLDKSLFTQADHETIDLFEKAVHDLRQLGATIIDPGVGGALFQDCINCYLPQNMNSRFAEMCPSLFAGNVDQLSILEDLRVDPSQVAEQITIRDLEPRSAPLSEYKYYFNRYLRSRGDASIRNLSDLIAKSRYYRDVFGRDTRFRDVKAVLQEIDQETELDLEARDFKRAAIQRTVMQGMAMLDLDAVAYPTGNVPPGIIGAPVEPTVNGRSHQAWDLLGRMGFPAITVPAGFTTQVVDRIRDANAPGGTRLLNPVPARLPVGIDFLAMPFDEPMLLRIASAYEAATKHRSPPPPFGSLNVP